MKTKLLFLISLFLISKGFSQSANQDSLTKRHFLGSTFFILMTPLLNPSPEYFQVNYGFRISPKDVLSFEAITWTYTGPLGRQYGPNYENEASDFPGSVKAYGAGLAYKRFLWKRAYSQIHATAFRQDYRDRSDNKIQSGFQLFTTLRFGYQLQLFKNVLFIEPSIAFTSWPINTNLPESFQVEEDKWKKFFLFEPGLHFGINF